MTDTLGVLIFGAHPDDPDVSAGGVAALYSRAGHRVKMVSLTNGDAGHYREGGAPLAWRRLGEARAAGKRLGAEYLVLDNHDGELLPTLEVRREVIRIIREFRPDLILTPRPYDYHPDHRATSQLVQDAIFLVTVPNVVSDAPHLREMPVVAYVADRFQKPYPFSPDVVVDIGAVAETKVEAMSCHVSQAYEWLPYNRRQEGQVPEDLDARRQWLRAHMERRLRWPAEAYRDKLLELYGERGVLVQYAEAFEACEYGSPLTAANLERLFPFFGKRQRQAR